MEEVAQKVKAKTVKVAPTYYEASTDYLFAGSAVDVDALENDLMDAVIGVIERYGLQAVGAIKLTTKTEADVVAEIQKEMDDEQKAAQD